MHKEVDVIEQPVKINMVVQPVDTEVQEPAVDVAVLVDDQDIEVEDVHIVDIEMTEAFPFMTNGALNEHMDDKDVLLDGGIAVDKNDEYVLLQDLLEISAGSGMVSHPDLHGRELSNQHPISAIDKLQENLDALGATERVYSSSNGLGEFRQWKDGNPEGEDRSGYFVAIVPGTDEIEICDATHDVYGISVHNSGFIGNQDDLYYKGKDLLNNNANDPSYAVVGIVGAMRVRTDGTARNGDYVVPNAYGEATLSENDYGYKVLSQGSYPSYNYVTIAITPQSDALSRLQSSVTSGDLGEILIKIENVENSVGDLEVKVDASTEDIEDILGEIGDLQQRVITAEEVVKDAVEQAEEAKDVATQAASKAAQAQQDAQDAAAGAISSANQALSDVSNLAEQMEPIVSWQSEDGLYNSAGGFVNQANEDHTILSSIVAGSGPEGSNLAAIIQKVDENGAIIQHLVSHVDRYVVGENSLSDGLTHDEAKSILTEEYIYVPTYDHDETMTGEPNVVTNFKRGYYYVWDVINGVWAESTTQVSMATAYNDGSAEGDLWYCWQDVVVEDDTYISGTLYRWFGDEWVAVATTADNRNARILTSIRQEADSIHMDVVNLQGDVSSIEQNVDSITTRVGTAEGNISSITQEVSDIQSNISTIDGTVSSLQQHADDTDASLTAIALGRFPTAYNTFIDTVPPTPYDGKRYTHPPVWDDEKQEFVFNEAYASSDGAYYFHSDDKTKYCHVTNNGYDLCTIGKEVTAMLDNRIDENVASIDALVTFKNNTTTSLANISAQVDTNKSNITSLTTKVNDNSSSLAAVSQKADDNSASIGLVVQRVDGVIDGNGNLTDESISSKGSIIIQAINGESSAKIDADKIKLTATDEITLLVKEAKEHADKRVTIVASSQMFIKATDATKYTPNEIILTAKTSGDIKSYQWYKDDVLLASETSKSLTVRPADVSANSATYKVVGKDADGKEYTDMISIAKLSDGKDGIVYYTWVKYADSPTSGMSDNPDGKEYIGLAYNKTSQNESTDYGDYQWSLIKGADGIGVDGKTYYTWVKYADDASGTNMSDSPTGKKYIGLAYNKEVSTESKKPSDYTWALFKGSDGIAGEDGYTVVLSNEFIEVPVGSNRKPKNSSTYTCKVDVYKGLTELTPTTGTPAEMQFKVGVVREPTAFAISQSSAGILTIVFDSQKAIQDISEIPLEITVHSGIVLSTKIIVRANMNDVTVNQVASMAEIKQTVDDQGASIEMVVATNKDGNKQVRGGILITAINGESNAQIDAERVNIAASKMFSAVVADGKVTPASIVAAIDNTEGESKVVLSADHINLAASEMFSAVVGEDGTITPASIIAAIDNTSGDTKVVLSADHIKLDGYVTINSLSETGSTEIDGSRIKTGLIRSDGYQPPNGSVYSQSGTEINLNNGSITSKNFAINADGIIYTNAAIINYGVMNYATINDAMLTRCGISQRLTIIGGNNGVGVSYLSNQSTDSVLSINDGQFSVSANGYVTVNQGLELLSTKDTNSIIFKGSGPYLAYQKLSHIDAYYENGKYYSRWSTDKIDSYENVIKIHSVYGNLSIDAGPLGEVHIGNTGDNGGLGQMVYINSQYTGSQTDIRGLTINIGETNEWADKSTINLIGTVYLNGTLLTSSGSGGGVAVFG